MKTLKQYVAMGRASSIANVGSDGYLGFAFLGPFSSEEEAKKHGEPMYVHPHHCYYVDGQPKYEVFWDNEDHTVAQEITDTETPLFVVLWFGRSGTFSVVGFFTSEEEAGKFNYEDELTATGSPTVTFQVSKPEEW